ncbi:hypothetical protein [Corynebacterium aquilae]|uniref:hypothetical protein n=1 Tax=Corynebacterium aquilae TaxID=203263 RepID=UPI000A0584B8|nr:hypothetical protein [Corynebacterium aquilae]
MDAPDTAACETQPKDSGRGEKTKWWDQPGMPWKRKPTRADKLCFAAFVGMGIFAVAMMPLNAYLLGAEHRLPWAVAAIGSKTGGAALGAMYAVGKEVPLLWPILLGGLARIKFDWIYWWAGALWGRGIIEMSAANRSKQARRNYERAEKWAHKLGWLGIFVAYVPIP